MGVMWSPLTGMIFYSVASLNILNFSQTWFIVARVDSGGIDNNGDSLLSYGFAGEGRWELRSQNQSSFNSKIAKNSSWLPTITQTVSLDNYHLFTLTADRNNSTFSNWVNGQIQTNAVHDPIGIWEKQKITSWETGQLHQRPLVGKWLK